MGVGEPPALAFCHPSHNLKSFAVLYPELSCDLIKLYNFQEYIDGVTDFIRGIMSNKNEEKKRD